MFVMKPLTREQENLRLETTEGKGAGIDSIGAGNPFASSTSLLYILKRKYNHFKIPPLPERRLPCFFF